MEEMPVPNLRLGVLEAQDPSPVGPLHVCEGELPSTDVSLQENKPFPAVAVYAFQYYPGIQGCVTTTSSSQLTTSAVIPQVSLQQATFTVPCFISEASELYLSNQNVDVHISIDGKSTENLEPVCLVVEKQEIKQSSQCIVTQDNSVPTSKVPLIEKWKGGEIPGDHHVTIAAAELQENTAPVQQTNHATQVTTEILPVHSGSNSKLAYATETIHSADRVVRTQPGEKPYSCNVCGKVFARAHNLKAHSQIHSPRLPFPCRICQKSYSQEAYYRTHSEMLSGSGPFTCEVCSKVFCNSRSFNFHGRSHSRRKCIA